MNRLVTLLVAVAGTWLALPAHAEIAYTVMPLPDKAAVVVEMAFVSTQPVTQLQIPRWEPGVYLWNESYKKIDNLQILNKAGSKLSYTQPNEHTWSIVAPRGERLTVRYERAVQGLDSALFFDGAETYFYVAGRKEEPHRLRFQLPGKWRIAVGLVPSKAHPHAFTARNYDVLADSPAMLGEFQEIHYEWLGKDHVIAIAKDPGTIEFMGEPTAPVDLERLLKATRFATQIMTDFFGGAPYERFAWLLTYPGAGGLEHLNSTHIGISPEINALDVQTMAHEFFHLWNVKRIRPKSLGPFDYTRLPQTGSMWWLEGVTTYYAALLLHRYGWTDRQELYQSLYAEIAAVRRNEDRFGISPYEHSRSKSSGLAFGLNYANGNTLGLLLDVELRARTGGRRSLDDVVLALWERCRGDRHGFAEDEIRRQLVRFGGPALGAFYDKHVLQPGELPIEQALEKLGLRMVEERKVIRDKPVVVGGDIEENPRAGPQQVRLRETWLRQHRGDRE